MKKFLIAIVLILATGGAWAQSPLIEVWKDVYAVPLVRDHFTVQRGDIIPYRVHLIDSSFNPIPMDQATRSAAVQVLYEPGITARVYSATLYASAAIIQADPTINLLPGDYILQSVLYEEPGHTIIMIGSEENLTITPKPDISFGDIAFTNINDFTAYVSNQVALSVSNQVLVILTNNINVGQTFVSNYIANVISNFVDATVTVPGLTVNVSNIKIPIENILTPGIPSGAVIRADGNALYADTNFQASVLVRQGTNDLGYADTLTIGPGLMAGVSNGEAVIELSGINFPGAPGVTLTNVVYYHSLGTKTSQWYQVGAGVTKIAVQGYGGGGGGGGAGAAAAAAARVTIPVQPYEWLEIRIGEKGFRQINTTGAPEFTDQAWPDGGRGASRVLGQAMFASGASTTIWRGPADTNTFTNLLLVIAGAASPGRSDGFASPGGNGGGVIGENGASGQTGALVGMGATSTNHGGTAFASFAGLAITGAMPARLRGGDAMISTNYVGPSAGGSPGWFSGSGSGGNAVGGNQGAGGGSGNSWFNESLGVRGEIASGKNDKGPVWTEDFYYRNAGVRWGENGQHGGLWIAEIVEVP